MREEVRSLFSITGTSLGVWADIRHRRATRMAGSRRITAAECASQTAQPIAKGSLLRCNEVGRGGEVEFEAFCWKVVMSAAFFMV